MYSPIKIVYKILLFWSIKAEHLLIVFHEKIVFLDKVWYTGE